MTLSIGKEKLNGHYHSVEGENRPTRLTVFQRMKNHFPQLSLNKRDALIITLAGLGVAAVTAIDWDNLGDIGEQALYLDRSDSQIAKSANELYQDQLRRQIAFQTAPYKP